MKQLSDRRSSLPLKMVTMLGENLTDSHTLIATYAVLPNLDGWNVVDIAWKPRVTSQYLLVGQITPVEPFTKSTARTTAIATKDYDFVFVHVVPFLFGGPAQNRTGVNGFAGRRVNPLRHRTR